MLTADLSLSWERDGEIRPRLLGAQDPRWLGAAETLVRIFAEHVGRARGELDRTLDDYVGAGTNYKVFRGLAKLLLDRSEFANSVEFVPSELRRAVFLRARESHPLDGTAEARARIFEDVSRELRQEPGALAAGLYADLEARQKLIAFEEIGAAELIDAYNLAQAQALLYRCVRLRLRVKPQGADGYRALFGAIKAHRLIHAVRGDAAGGYEIQLDGPASLFHRSQKYGVQMAVFLPDLLACAGWEMSAEIATRRGAAFFELSSERHTLRSPAAGLRGYENPVREKLQESWARFETDWTLEPSTEVIDFGGGAFIPDFTLRHPDGQVVHLELLGFWTPEHLTERLRELGQAGLRNFLLAAWEELRGSREPFAREDAHVVVFKRTLEPVAVEWAAEKLVIQEQVAAAAKDDGS
jgi:predicted nuclease of restriction endonuclease-like RecB superfamily